MTAPTAQTLRDHLPRLLAAAGWTRRGRHAFRRADRILSLDRNRIFLTEVDLPEGPIIVLEAHVTSVEQAVAYLRIAEVLPAVEPIGYVVAIREHDRWTENWDGELHKSVEAARRSRNEAEAGGYEALVTELRAVTS